MRRCPFLLILKLFRHGGETWVDIHEVKINHDVMEGLVEGRARVFPSFGSLEQLPEPLTTGGQPV